MKDILGLELKNESREELLPDFSPEFPYIATRALLDRYAEPVIPWHWHRAVELFYMEKGCLEYTTPGGKWLFPEGSGGFVNANVLHSTRMTGQGEGLQLLHIFEPFLISGEPGSRIERLYVTPLVSDPDIEIIPFDPAEPEQAELLGLVRKCFDLREEEPGYELRLRESLSRIWLRLLELTQPTGGGGRPRSDSRIKSMMLYVQEHWNKPIFVEELAAAAYVSKRECFRLFREKLHMSPVEYINTFRLRQAAAMLVGSDASVTDIASACALGSASYFGKLFRANFGCTPGEYRHGWHDSAKK